MIRVLWDVLACFQRNSTETHRSYWGEWKISLFPWKGIKRKHPSDFIFSVKYSFKFLLNWFVIITLRLCSPRMVVGNWVKLLLLRNSWFSDVSLQMAAGRCDSSFILSSNTVRLYRLHNGCSDTYRDRPTCDQKQHTSKAPGHTFKKIG